MSAKSSFYNEHDIKNNEKPVLETKAGPSVRDRQLLVRTRNFLHIYLQINVWISQNSDQDRQLFQLSPEHCEKHVSWAQRSLQNHHQTFHDRCPEKIGPLPKKSDHLFTQTFPENIGLASTCLGVPGIALLQGQQPCV